MRYKICEKSMAYRLKLRNKNRMWVVKNFLPSRKFQNIHVPFILRTLMEIPFLIHVLKAAIIIMSKITNQGSSHHGT